MPSRADKRQMCSGAKRWRYLEQGFCPSALKGPSSAQKGQGRVGHGHQNIPPSGSGSELSRAQHCRGVPELLHVGCVLSTPGTACSSPALPLSHTRSPLLIPLTCQLALMYRRAYQAFFPQLWNLPPQKHFVLFKIPFFFSLFFSPNSQPILL